MKIDSKILFKHFVLLTFLSILGCKSINHKNVSSAKLESRLIELFKPNQNFPKISAHRGGMGIKGYPENCLETMQYLNDSIKAIFEIDIAKSKDDRLILMHDKSLERTTTGSGIVENYTVAQLQDFYLLDQNRNITDYKIPLLIDVLKWAKANNVILTLDIKKNVSQKEVIDIIYDNKVEDNCIIITYDALQAKSAYDLAPNLLLSVSARNKDEFNRLRNTKIPLRNFVAFTGTRLPNNELIKSLREKNILCMLGTLGNLDNMAEARGDYLYKDWMEEGIDILATDRPFAVNNIIYE